MRGIGNPGLVALVVIFIRLGLRGLLDFLEQLGIEYGRADSVAPTRPFAEIGQPATIAAEGKMLIRAQNDAFAGRAAQTESFLTDHNL